MSKKQFEMCELETFAIENGLEVLAYTIGESFELILARESKDSQNPLRAHYLYKISDDISCDFSLLSECNNTAKRIFKRMMKKLKMRAVTVDSGSEYYEKLTN